LRIRLASNDSKRGYILEAKLENLSPEWQTVLKQIIAELRLSEVTNIYQRFQLDFYVMIEENDKVKA